MFQLLSRATLLVRGFECVGDLRRNRQRLVEWDRTARDPLCRHRKSDFVKNMVGRAVRKGIRIWQVNFDLGADGVRLARHFDITDGIS
jgi:hypothetical protein